MDSFYNYKYIFFIIIRFIITNLLYFHIGVQCLLDKSHLDLVDTWTWWTLGLGGDMDLVLEQQMLLEPQGWGHRCWASTLPCCHGWVGDKNTGI